ncbi:MAG: methyltransferase domain-containing protein [Planctomycetes bacterium]|nr:methyltransferase domain-containing protein [Planctomycetota bacterium]
MGFGDQVRETRFKGTLEGQTFKGQSSAGDSTRDVTGKKLVPVPAPVQQEVVIKPMARQPDVIYVPTPKAVVEKMLELAEVKPGDVVYDLGCGDGRIVVTAAKRYGVRAYGYDINPERVKESLENVRENGVEHLVSIDQEDIFTLDLSKANVITLYLLPSLNVKLMPQLAKCKPGTRIVSHDFDMRGAKPVVRLELNVNDDSDENTNYGPSHTIYKWVVPWEEE